LPDEAIDRTAVEGGQHLGGAQADKGHIGRCEIVFLQEQGEIVLGWIFLNHGDALAFQIRRTLDRARASELHILNLIERCNDLDGRLTEGTPRSRRCRAPRPSS
jgi:hypothetical protein